MSDQRNVTWWYAKGGQKYGPKTFDEICYLVREDEITEEILVWTPEMEQWSPAGTIRQLADVFTNIPPPLPPEKGHEVVSEHRYADAREPAVDPRHYAATPWPRFFARIFDVWLESLPAGFLLGALWYSLNAEQADYLFSNTIAASIIVLPFVMIIDGFVVGLFGNSLGKAVLGIKVVSNNQGELTVGDAISRNFGMWFRGLAIGIPLVNLFTMASAYSKLARGEMLQWDIDGNVTVARTGKEQWRYLLFTVLFGVLLFVNAMLAATEV